MSGEFAVHVVNPRKGGRPRKGHRRNPDGPSGGGSPTLLRIDWMRIAWMIAGDLWIAYFTRRWGDPYGTSMLDGKKLSSPYAGEAWNLKNYLYAAGTGFGIAKFLQRMKKGTQAADFMLGIKVGIIRRLLWTEGLARTTWGPKYFGDVQDVYGQDGGVWMRAPGGNGYQQVMDGPQAPAQRWMMLGPEVGPQNWMMLGNGEEMTNFAEQSPMGHAVVGPNYTVDRAQYDQTGGDPYSAVYGSST